VLALEASTRRPGVALLDAEGALLAGWTPEADVSGTAELAWRAGELLAGAGLAAADLAGVAVGVGPGSYTGLRSAIALARGLAFGAGLPLAGVHSSAAAARGLLADDPELTEVVVLLDARRGELYRADYRRGPPPAPPAPPGAGGDAPSWTLLESAPPRLVAADAPLPEPTRARLIAREPPVSAYHVAVLGRARLRAGGDDPARVLPLYLKRSHAELAAERRDR
jgi:tRNA threonylcarbamoyladenosine biosynthesis protein TsaB